MKERQEARGRSRERPAARRGSVPAMGCSPSVATKTRRVASRGRLGPATPCQAAAFRPVMVRASRTKARECARWRLDSEPLSRACDASAGGDAAPQKSATVDAQSGAGSGASNGAAAANALSICRSWRRSRAFIACSWARARTSRIVSPHDREHDHVR
jgi:hypothetical protein